MANNICDCDLNTLRTQHSPQNNDSTAPIVGWLAFTMSEALLPKACGPDGTFDVTGDLIFTPHVFSYFHSSCIDFGNRVTLRAKHQRRRINAVIPHLRDQQRLPYMAIG